MKEMFNNIPNEILCNIFQQLDDCETSEFHGRPNLWECRLVCRSWYLPATCQLLRYVYLQSIDDIESFLSFIKVHPEYSDTVEELSVYISKKEDSRRIEPIKKLFGLKLNIKEFRTDLHQTCKSLDLDELILQAFPKLERYYFPGIDFIGTSYQTLMNGFRGSLKQLKFAKHIPDSLDGFQQLQKINASKSERYKNCIDCLPLFQQEFTLNSLKTKLNGADKNFFTRYLESKTEETQKKILWKLSKLETLEVLNNYLLCPNEMEFVSQYMTGLQNVKIWRPICGAPIEESYSELLQNGFLNLVCRLYSCQFEMYFGIEARLPLAIMKTFYHQLPLRCRGASRVLELVLHGWCHGTTDFIFKSTKLHNGNIERRVTIRFFREDTIEFLRNMAISILGIDTLVLSYCLDFETTYNMEIIKSILDSVPGLSKIYLELPKSTTPIAPLCCEKTQKKQYPQVTDLEIKKQEDMHLELASDCFSNMFPNVTSLKLNHFCGMYNEDKREYQVFLPNAKLDRLHLDIRPLWQRVNRSPTITVDYFILDVRVKDQQQLFKITLKDLGVTKISNSDIISEFTGSEDNYLRLHVYVESVQFILLNLCKNLLYRSEDYYYSRYQRENVSQTRLYLNWP